LEKFSCICVYTKTFISIIYNVKKKPSMASNRGLLKVQSWTSHNLWKYWFRAIWSLIIIDGIYDRLGRKMGYGRTHAVCSYLIYMQCIFEWEESEREHPKL